MSHRCGECGGRLVGHRCEDCGTRHGDQREPHPEPPDWFTDAHLVVAEAMWADTWTDPKPGDPPEWHHRFQWWMCVAAARLVVDAQVAHIGSSGGPDEG